MIYILSGPVHSGKTTLLMDTIPLLKEKNLDVGGYLSIALWEGGEVLRYDLWDFGQNQYHPFILRHGKSGWERIGQFFFAPETLNRAKKIIQENEERDLCVVDEVGPLELSEKGVWPALANTLPNLRAELLLVIRDSVLQEMMKKLGRPDIVVLHISSNQTPQHLAQSLHEHLEKRKEKGKK